MDDYSNGNINGTNYSDNGGLGKGLQSLIPNKMHPSTSSGQAPSANLGQDLSKNLGQVPSEISGQASSVSLERDPAPILDADNTLNQPASIANPVIANSYVSPIFLEEDVDHNDKNDIEINPANNVFDFSSFRPIDSQDNLTNIPQMDYFKGPLANDPKETEMSPLKADSFSEIKEPSFVDTPNTNEEVESTTPEINTESDQGQILLNKEVPIMTVDNSPVDSTQDFSDIRGRIFQIEVDKIIPNTQQPRQDFNNESLWELASSIKEYGILEPLVVSRHEEETENGTKVHYQLISGERRLRASKLSGLKTVPVIIKESLDEKLKLELALIENIQREDLNSISKARAFTRLMSEFGLSQQAVATKMGKSREYVANTLRLLQLPYEAQKAMEEGKINEGHARAILLLPNPEKRRALLGIILSKNISGREAEEIAKSYLSPEMLSQKTRGSRMSASMDNSDLQLKELLENIFKKN